MELRGLVQGVLATRLHRTLGWVGRIATQCVVLSEPQELSQALLASYTDIFAEPHSLPPPRRHNHHIRLLPGTPPVAIRPYRYL
jgi:hypothetical protein